jgi:hypothetical protein
MTPEPDPNDCVVIEGEFEFICGGTLRPEDVPLMASTVYCKNGEIIPLLERRERQRARRERRRAKLRASSRINRHREHQA